MAAKLMVGTAGTKEFWLAASTTAGPHKLLTEPDLILNYGNN